MAEGAAVTMSNAVMEELRCFACKGYLSCRPIGVLSDGNFMCGRCSPNAVTVVARALVFEAVLSNTAFPCSFNQNGCTQRLFFDQTINHELKCAYRSFMCPSLLSCWWEGSMSQIHKHFLAVHPTLVKQKPDFKIDINQNSNGIFAVVNNNIMFIVNYLYVATNRNLKYTIRFCNYSISKVSYKLQLINESDADCNINLKTRNCSVYSETFYDMISKTTVELNKFIPRLDNPSCIRVCIDFKVQGVNVNTENYFAVNCKLLESLKCIKCCMYSVPPLYESDGNIICYDCSKSNNSSKVLNDSKLLQLATEIDFPCRWHYCQRIMKSNNLRNHELECNFRMYDCFLCTDMFRLEAAGNHYSEKHQALQATKDIRFKFSFSQCFDQKTIIVVMNKEIFLLQYRLDVAARYSNGRKYKLYYNILELEFYSSDLNMNNVELIFGHKHCKVKSNVFQLEKNVTTSIGLTQLPPCFKNEYHELTGFIYLNEENIYKQHEK